MLVFVDTSAWIALHDKGDDLHRRAIQVRTGLYRRNHRLFTSEFVLLEFADAFCSPRMRVDAHGVITKLRAASNFTIEPASSSLFDQALTLYHDRPDKQWSLTDCTSFVIMKERGIQWAFTSDRHFEQAGFTKLL